VRSCASCHADNPDDARFCNACGSRLDVDPSAETRKLVTVIFCDLAGSTELGESLDAESLRKVMTRYYDEMRAAIERHGGTVEKFIGDAVVAVFGIPNLHEDDAVRAVRAATEMRDVLVPLNAELDIAWGVRLETRMGVNSGEVVATDAGGGQSFMTGGPVNLAARLEQAAGVGEILLGDATLNLVRDAVSTQAVGPLSLKGLGEISAHRLLDVIPGAAGHARRLDSPLVDRERESALLRETFERTVAGRQCQLFTILGAAGVGKSRLVEEFLTTTGERALALRGRCLPYGEGITFWPVVEIVTEAAGLADSDPPAEARRKIAQVVAGERRGERAAERVAQVIGIGESSAGVDETFWAIRTFLESLARRRPLVVMLDDVHWAEPTLLDLIDHVADWSKDVPIMVITLSRPDLLEARPTWGGGKVNATTVLLEPLTDGDSEALVANLLGAGNVSPDARDRIIEAAGGNPFFVEEIVSMLIDDGLLVREDGSWLTTADLSHVALPPTISALLAARLDRLEPAEREAIQLASVIGGAFSIDAVEALRTTEMDVDVQVRSLVRKELLRPERAAEPSADLYRFRHILIRDAAYEAIPKQLRSDLHERFADWLQTWAGTRVEEYEEILGYHLEEAHRYLTELGPSDDHARSLAGRAGARLAVAGRRAAARGDMSASVGLLRRAARLLPPDEPLRLETLMALHDSLLQAGDIERSGRVLDELAAAAAAANDRAFEERAVLGQIWLRFLTDPQGMTIDELRTDVDETIARSEALGDDAGVARALEPLATIHWLTGNASAMLDASERALRLAVEAGERRVVTAAVSYVGRALVLGTTPCSDALKRLEELAAELEDDATAQSAARLEIATLLSMLGRFDEARTHTAIARETFQELGQRRRLAGAEEISGLIARAEGRLEDAAREIRAGYAFFHGQDDAANATLTAADLAQVLCELGRFDEADDLADEVRTQAGTYDLEPQIGWRCVRALVLANGGNHARAEELARSALALVEPTEFLSLQADVLVDLSSVLADAGRLEEAASSLEDALDRRRRKEDLVGVARAEERLAALTSR
jgi:class 3 adenylate cyclase/tetratricopeptide (TPR) repeat protein